MTSRVVQRAQPLSGQYMATWLVITNEAARYCLSVSYSYLSAAKKK